VKRFVSGRAMRRVIAAAIGLIVIAGVAAPASTAARGDAATTIAVNTFQNEAGAPIGVAADLSTALYKAVATSGKFASAGGGPLPLQTNLTSDAFVDALDAAAKAGANEVLIGSIVQMSGGQVFYRLSLYRVAPVAFIASQIFSQPYPPSDTNALPAGFAGDVETLASPRQAVGTIYSTDSGVLADTGSSEGFMLGDRFNVMRGGQKMAEATISQLSDDQATLTISNASPGYAPAMGDTLVGLRPLAPAEPAPPSKSTFDPLAFLGGVAGVLLAIGHHGLPGSPTTLGSGSPQPSSSPFALITDSAVGTVPDETITFTFNQVFDANTATGITGNITFAYVTLAPPGGGGATTPPAPLSSLGNAVVSTVTGTLGQPESQLAVGTSEPGLVTGEAVSFIFTPLVEDEAGQFLANTTVNGTLSVMRKPFAVTRKKLVGPVAPGPGGPVAPHPLPKPPPGDPNPARPPG
jgi:hypothetical protein